MHCGQAWQGASACCFFDSVPRVCTSVLLLMQQLIARMHGIMKSIEVQTLGALMNNFMCMCDISITQKIWKTPFVILSSLCRAEVAGMFCWTHHYKLSQITVNQ